MPGGIGYAGAKGVKPQIAKRVDLTTPSSGTITAPAFATWCEAFLTGPGGTSIGGVGNQSGGGAAARKRKRVAPNASLSYVVGSPGNATTLTFPDGTVVSAGSGMTGGAGGTATGGDENTSGSAGAAGVGGAAASITDILPGGAGGGSGVAGTAPGGGGGENGGTGAPGRLIAIFTRIR